MKVRNKKQLETLAKTKGFKVTEKDDGTVKLKRDPEQQPPAVPETQEITLKLLDDMAKTNQALLEKIAQMEPAEPGPVRLRHWVAKVGRRKDDLIDTIEFKEIIN